MWCDGKGEEIEESLRCKKQKSAFPNEIKGGIMMHINEQEMENNFEQQSRIYGKATVIGTACEGT